MGEACVVAMYGSKQHSVGEGEGVRSLKRYKTLGKEGKVPKKDLEAFPWPSGCLCVVFEVPSGRAVIFLFYFILFF